MALRKSISKYVWKLFFFLEEIKRIEGTFQKYCLLAR